MSFEDYMKQENYSQALITGGDVVKIGIEEPGEIFRWIIIDGIQTRYLVSNIGNVYTTINRCYILPKVDNHGYLCVSFRLPTSSKPKTLRVHRLVLGVFYEGEPPKTIETVNHINGDKGDNRIENLEYCSVAENNRHFASKLKIEQQQIAILKTIQLKRKQYEIDKLYKEQQKNNPRGRNDISDFEYKKIKELVEHYYPDKLICIEYNINKSVIKGIKSGNEDRTPPDQVPEDVIILICEDLHEGILTKTEISRKYNVRWSTVQYLYNKEWKKFEYIWENYDFGN